ncbi:hypothetical protein Q7P37_009176 [Cladosporium fusiforme]
MSSKVTKNAAARPVKLACTSCRAIRAKCDGTEPCSRCVEKQCACFYVKSRRGGARWPRSKTTAATGNDLQRQSPGTQESITGDDGTWDSHISAMISPGSGLLHLDHSMFTLNPGCCALPTQSPPVANSGSQSRSPEAQQSHPQSFEPGRTDDPLRTYHSDHAILDAYYRWIHLYLPILPPPPSENSAFDAPSLTVSDQDDHSQVGSVPASPLRLALSAIFALIPHPSVSNPSRPSYVALRRKAAHQFAQQSLALIEDETEMPQDLSPSVALAHTASTPKRPSLHPDVPVELESVLSLCVLAIYEYSQRGNIRKMQDRAGQALISAMRMSLHCLGKDESLYTEAKRRAWWMTYICSCQASIASCTEPTLLPNDSRFTTSYPNMNGSHAWQLYIDSQQAILAATQFVIEMNQYVKEPQNYPMPFEKMQNLHRHIDELILFANQEPLVNPQQPTDPEATAARALRCMSIVKLNSARIKLHRYSAFSDIPVFTKRYCDLKQAPTNLDLEFVDDLVQWLTSCACDQAQSQTLDNSHHPSTPTPAQHPTDPSNPAQPPTTLPFTKHESSLLCLTSALTIAHAFESLPYPTPSPTSTNPPNQTIPRTLPSFACCAMQSAYALLMVCNQAWAMQTTGAMILQVGSASSHHGSHDGACNTNMDGGGGSGGGGHGAAAEEIAGPV